MRQDVTTRSRRRSRAVTVGLNVVLPTAVMLIVAVVICMGVTTVTLLLPALGATAAAALTVTLDAAPAISLVFMRLPDGNRRGTGNRIHDFESLKRLWEGDIPTISAVDGTATYDRESLQRTLTGLMDDFEASTVRTQNWTIEFGAGDNADHTATALFVREAAQMSPTEHTLVAYLGYPSWRRTPNVSGHDLGVKAAAIVAYAAHDPKMCVEPQCVDAIVASILAARQYVVAIELLGAVGPSTTLGQVQRR